MNTDFKFSEIKFIKEDEADPQVVELCKQGAKFANGIKYDEIFVNEKRIFVIQTNSDFNGFELVEMYNVKNQIMKNNKKRIITLNKDFIRESSKSVCFGFSGEPTWFDKKDVEFDAENNELKCPLNILKKKFPGENFE